MTLGRGEEPVYEWEGFLCRRHPHRLNPDDYRVPGQPVLTTICAKDKRPVLTRDAIRGELTAALSVATGITGCELIAWCLMPDHIHVLLRVEQQGGDIIRFLHSYKTWTGRRMRTAGFARGWERSFWDRHARSREDTANMVSYVLQNPVRAGLCQKWEQWPHSEYCWGMRERRTAGRGGT